MTDLMVRVEHHSDWHAYIACPQRGELGYCLGHGGDQVVDEVDDLVEQGEAFDGETATRVLAREGWTVTGPWRETAPEEGTDHQWEAPVARQA